MRFKPLGTSGVMVSELCFGTMSFGGDADEAMSGRMYRACRDAGINFFDTADQYNDGRSEEILGRLIGADRENLVLATKCFNPMSADINDRGTSRRHVTRAVDASLRRLRTDRIDILYLHQFDARTPVEEQMRGLEDVVRSGKVLYPAASNFAAWQAQRALGIQERHGWARLQATQPMYSLVKRQAEVEILPQALDARVSAVPYSPTGGGLLSGKYLERSAQGRHVTNKQYKDRYGEEWVHETAAKFVAFCRARGWHPVSAAVAWVAAHPAVTAPIIGARNTEQLPASLDAVKIPMTPEVREEIAALSRTPPPATDRSEEQKKA